MQCTTLQRSVARRNTRTARGSRCSRGPPYPRARQSRVFGMTAVELATPTIARNGGTELAGRG
jgi:hypothetical protein